MAKPKIQLEVKLAWWFTWIYIPCLQLMLCLARLVNPEAEINIAKMRFWIDKATTVTTVKNRNTSLGAKSK